MSSSADVAHTPAIAVATAVLAVFAAIGTMVSNKAANEALAVKNQAILVRTDASDAYNSYESHEIRAHVYEAAGLTTKDAGSRERAERIASSETTAAAPYLASAKAKEREAARDSERSEGLVHAHELYDISIALVEIAVARVDFDARAVVVSRRLFGAVRDYRCGDVSLRLTSEPVAVSSRREPLEARA